MKIKNKNEDIKSIGDKLDVNNILEGSVRRQGNKIMISVRLTNAENGFTIFSESYSDELENIFALQSAIAIDIAGRTDGESTVVTSIYTVNDEAGVAI